MKRILAMLLAVLLVMALVPMSVSARTMTEEEKALFVYLRDAAKVLDDGSKDVAGALAQGENYVCALSEPLTTNQINMIKAKVEEAVAAAKKEETGNVKEWSEETRSEVLEKIDEAAKVVDCTAVADTKGTVTVKDQQGQTIVVATPHDTVIKTTGFGAMGVIVSASVVLALLCACAYVSKKALLF